ncbi:MAG TPA: hypothetical protein PKI63_05990 [Candidatus Cloacimonadota bacterium]|nr:hypothetical protein [Candidatus Cloacimonadota bacterium]
MNEILTKPNGNISIAMLLMVISMMSGFTMASMALRDVISFQYDYESIQSQIMLRSEAYRGQAIMEKIGGVIVPLSTSERTVEVSGTNMKKTFKIKSLLTPGGFEMSSDDVVAGDQKQVTQVHSRVNTKAGIGQAAYTNPRRLIRKYGVFTLETETFAKFMYFTDIESDPNGFPVRFYGPDVLYGRVHSNQDIWIRQAGGGNNNNWPTFWGWVSTCGVIKVYPDGGHTFPETDVFRGGLSEGYPYTVFPEQATRIRRNGTVLGPSYFDVNKIVYADVDGVSAQAMLGTIQDPIRQFADVYTNNSFPPGQGEPAWTNQYTVRDTMWVNLGSSSTINKSRFVYGRLWLKGNFSRYQTWGCGDTLFIIGDILLQGTPRGDSPSANRRDVVGLVSEKSILVKYGYRSPIDSLRYKETSGPTTGNPLGGVWIYAAMAALGDGHGNARKDGVFTFEYQHPHPSTPDYRIGNTIFTKIDLHRRRYPQTSSAVWPPLLDYPWYNPLWPERFPYCERGYINVHGSISQRRRGFVHRNYTDADYPNNAGIWNQPIDFCGGTSSPNGTLQTDPVLGFQMATQHAPGASGTGVGYQKNYHYDDRFYKTSPIDFPEINRKDETPFAAVKWEIRSPRLIPSQIIN